MNFKQLFTDKRAVSPVIGVILMVAITVILAAVIGTFVLGLGDSLSQTVPQASFSFDHDEVEGNGTVTITHEGGDSIDAALLTTTNDGGWLPGGEPDWTNGDTRDSVNAGASVIGTNDGPWSGENVRVVWESQDGSSSSTIGRSTAPN